jgi:hypothetical protein
LRHDTPDALSPECLEAVLSVTHYVSPKGAAIFDHPHNAAVLGATASPVLSSRWRTDRRDCALASPAPM